MQSSKHWKTWLGLPLLAACQAAELAGAVAHLSPAGRAVFGFVRGNTCRKEEIGLKTTGNGLLAICNWHLLNDAPEEELPPEMSAPGALSDPQDIIAGLLPHALPPADLGIDGVGAQQ